MTAGFDLDVSSRARYQAGLLVIGGGTALSVVHHVLYAWFAGGSPVRIVASFIPPVVAACIALSLVGTVRTSDIPNERLARAVWWYVGGGILFAVALTLSFASHLGSSQFAPDVVFSVVNWAISGSAVGLVVAHYDLHRTQALVRARANERRSARLAQRMSVLNRVLRHDVRNKLTVIKGYASLREGESIDPVDAVVIEEAADALLTIADRAGRVRKITEDETPRPVDLTTSVRDLLGNLREEFPDAHVTADECEDVTVATYPAILVGLAELMENAIVHNSKPESGCEIRVAVRHVTTATETMGEVIIEDNGQGIPERERMVQTDATETQLQHSRGTSLWLTRWIVDESVGEFAIESRDGGGTRIAIRLPTTASRADRPARR